MENTDNTVLLAIKQELDKVFGECVFELGRIYKDRQNREVESVYFALWGEDPQVDLPVISIETDGREIKVWHWGGGHVLGYGWHHDATIGLYHSECFEKLVESVRDVATKTKTSVAAMFDLVLPPNDA